MKLQDFRTLIREMVEKEMQEMDQIEEKKQKQLNIKIGMILLI